MRNLSHFRLPRAEVFLFRDGMPPTYTQKAFLCYYDKEDGSRDIYFIATDWHKKNPDGKATLVIDSEKYEINVPWGQLVKVTVKCGAALQPENDECEVLSIDGETARVQGIGKTRFFVYKNGKQKCIDVDFAESELKSISIN